MTTLTLSLTPERSLFRPDWARIAGLAYLVLAACGIFAELGARMVVTKQGDPAGTVAAVRDHLLMMRWAVVADMGMILADIVLAVAFFALFWRARPVLTAILLLLQIARIPMMGANLTNHVAAVVLASGQELLPAFSPDQLDQLAYFFLRLHDYTYIFNGITFGAWCIVLGWILLSTGYAPKLVGVLLVLDGPIAFFGTIGALVYPAMMDQPWAQIVARSAYGELVMIGFLLVAPGYVRRRVNADL